MRHSYLLLLLSLLLFASTCLAGKGGSYQVFDDHFPVFGGGATGKVLEFKINDPAYKVIDGRNGKCGHLYLAGFAFGHPDPHDTDPKAVCGHGVVTIVDPPRERPPLSILPIEAPMPVENGGEVTLDSAQIIRNLLPRLDKSEGDKHPMIVQLRQDILFLDVLKASKNAPKRESKK